MGDWRVLYQGMQSYLLPNGNTKQFGDVFRWTGSLAMLSPASNDDAAYLAPYVFRAGETAGVNCKVAFILANSAVTAYLYHPLADTAVDADTTMTLMPVLGIPSFFLPPSIATIGIVQVQDITAEDSTEAVATIATNGEITLTLAALTASHEYIVGDTYSKLALLGGYASG